METYPTSIKISLIKETTGKEVVEELKKKYGAIENLKRLVEKHPEKFLSIRFRRLENLSRTSRSKSN